MSYVPRLAKVVNVLAIRQVKQGTETTMIALDLILSSKRCLLNVSSSIYFHAACKAALNMDLFFELAVLRTSV